MLRIDCYGKTRLALHAPKLIMSWHAVNIIAITIHNNLFGQERIDCSGKTRLALHAPKLIMRWHA